MNPRGRWQGALTILRFNWPIYLVAAVVLALSAAGAILIGNVGVRLVLAAAALGAGYFIVVSLGVSHLIYDRSDLYRLGWVNRAFDGLSVNDAIFCHTGFDETSAALARRLPGARWTLLDHFDPAVMTEPSIRRARAMYPPALGTVATPSDRWPVENATADAVFGLLAIHELRHDAQRRAWFAEAARALRPGGRVVIIEHLRDAANFMAFGPGFVHFHSRVAWERSWQRRGPRTQRRVPVDAVGARVCTDPRMTTLPPIALRTAGAGLILLAFMHGPIGRHLRWREEGARMSPVNAAIFRVHEFFICLVLVMMGLPSLLDPGVFLTPSRAGAWMSWSFAGFWAARLYFQWCVYPHSLWRGKRMETSIHFLFTVIWLGLMAVYAWCGGVQAGWLH